MKSSKILLPLLTLVLIVTATLAASAQVDVARRTTAATYPLNQLVTVQFRGTTRFPKMSGSAKIKRTPRNGTEIDLSVNRMPRPFELGAGYATYVLWAISPDGQVDNLGEIKRRGFFEFDSKIRVTTPLQTFALIITAEPHFLVRRPSQAIMLENLTPYAANGQQLSTTSAVQYFGNSSDYFRDPRTPEIAEVDYGKTPSSILQAKQAVALAIFAGAERDAATELSEASVSLQAAEQGWKAGRREDMVDIDARKAISAAVKAESTAFARREAREKRNEKARADAETRKAEDRVSSAQGQVESLKEELARETRNRELAERDAMNYSSQLKELRDENGQLREELGRLKLDAETAKAKLEAAENEKAAAQADRDKQSRIASARANEGQFISSLKRFGVVSKVDNSIVLVLPESYWSGTRSTGLAVQSDGKLTSLGEILANNPDYMVTIESHTDNTGAPEALQTLTETRASVINDKLKSLGVTDNRLRYKGFGPTVPAAPNTTAANKAKNRRVNIILDLNIQ